MKSIVITFILLIILSISIIFIPNPASFAQEEAFNQTLYTDNKLEPSTSDNPYLDNPSLNSSNLAIDVEGRGISDVDRLSRNIFTIEDNLNLCAIVTFKNYSLNPVPVTVTVSKIGEDKPVFSSSKYIFQNSEAYGCDEVNRFELLGIISSGDYVVKAQIIGTETYAQSLFRIDGAWYSYLKHEALTLQNAKIVIAILAFFIMIAYVLWTVIKGHPPSFGVDHKDSKDPRFELELKGIILMSIMVFSIVSFLGNVNQPIGSNTSFGIVKDAEIDLSRVKTVDTENTVDTVDTVDTENTVDTVDTENTVDTSENTSGITEDIRQSIEDIGKNIADTMQSIEDTRQSIEEQWVLNIGGIEKIVCIESRGTPIGPSLSYFKNRDYCYQPGKNLVQYSVVQGGIQIPLYVLILALIGGYLRYLYNIAKTQITKYRKSKSADTEKPAKKSAKKSDESKDTDETKNIELNESMRNFVQEFLYILLSPIVAIALWLFLRQGGIESSLSLALSSITIGLILKNVIETLESWAKTQLRVDDGKDGENNGEVDDGKDGENNGEVDDGKVNSNNKSEAHKK